MPGAGDAAARYVYHVPLAILATGLGLLSALSLGCGLLLDTTVRHRKEDSSCGCALIFL